MARWRIGRRRPLLRVHRWTGLTVGVLLMVTGLTGAAITFCDDIDSALNASLRVRDAGAVFCALDADAAVAAAIRAVPNAAQAYYLVIPREPNRMLIVYLRTAEHGGWKVFVDPCNSHVSGARPGGKYSAVFDRPLMEILIDLHARLVAGRSGEIILGVAALALLLSAIAGIALWWPLGGNWRAAFRVKPSARAPRVVYDVHKVAGLTGVLVLGVVLFSGAAMNLPDYLTPLVALFSPVPRLPDAVSGPAAGRHLVSLRQAIAVAGGVFPDGEVLGIALPEGPDGVFTVRKRAADEVAVSYTERQVSIDQFSGQVLAVNDPHRYSAGQRFLEWQYPLHSGEAFGLPGRIAVLAAGLLCPVLFVTGLIRWRQKAAGRRTPQATIKRKI